VRAGRIPRPPAQRQAATRAAVLVSAALHGLALGALLLPGLPRAAPVPVAPALIELVRQDTATGGGDRYVASEGGPGGAGQPDAPAAAPAPAAPPQAAATATPPVPPSPAMPTPPVPRPPMPAAAAPPPTPAVPMPPVPQVRQAAVPMPPRPPSAAEAVNLGDNGDAAGAAGTGQVLDDTAVVPAGVDSQVRNTPPAYPREAAQRGDEGKVGVLIHVLPGGTAGGVDVVQSSGDPWLDQAARAAALRWRYRPSLRDGQPVASDLLFRFDFALTRR
jgi:periplasmic protein TonB